MKSKMKWFIVDIEILSDEWDYKKGQVISMPVNTSSGYNAFRKIDNYYQGSEFPPYKILRVNMCDDFLFNPNRIIK